MSLWHPQMLFACLLLAGMIAAGAGSEAAAPDKYWDQQPYRIQVTLAIDAPGDLAEQLAADLPGYLVRRAEASIGPIWQLHVDPAEGGLRQHALRDLDSLTTKDLPKSDIDADKRVVLTIHATPWGYELAGREYDSYVDRWGEPLRASTRQSDSLAEQVFALVERAVTPLAQFHLDPANDRQVILLPRGASLPRVRATTSVGPRRVTFICRSIAARRATATWWQAATKSCRGRLSSSRKSIPNRRPAAFKAVRRVLSRFGSADASNNWRLRFAPTRARPSVRLRSRTQKEKPLVGYQVFTQNTGEHETKLRGNE